MHDGACTNFDSHSGLALSRQTFAGVAVRLHRPRKAGRCRLDRVPHETQQHRVEAWVDHVRTPRESAALRTLPNPHLPSCGEMLGLTSARPSLQALQPTSSLPGPAFAGTTAWSRATTAFWFQSAV